jgi:4-hydroxybenzoate polyprenyltransferase
LSLHFTKTIRSRDWWNYKTPLVLAAAYGAAYLSSIDHDTIFMSVGLVIWYVFALGSFGYVLNDLCDIEEDRLADKVNQMGPFSRFARVVILSGVVVIGFIPIALLSPPFALSVCFLNYLFPVLYSVKPIKLKERGLWGVIFDAAGAHVLPALYAITLVYESAGVNLINEQVVFTLTFSILTGLIGLRGILNHMQHDRENDKASGISTFVMHLSEHRFIFLIKSLFVLEGAFFILLALSLPSVTLSLLVGFIFYVTIMLSKYLIGWTWQYQENNQIKQNFRLPLQDSNFYLNWVPVILLAGLLLQDLVWAGILVIHVVLFFSNYVEEYVQIDLFFAELKRELMQRAKLMCEEYQGKRELQLYGGHIDSKDDGSFTIVAEKNHKLVITLIQSGTNLWKSKFRWDTAFLVPNTEYKLIFSAQSESEMDIVLGFWQDDAPWKNLGLYQVIKLSPEFQEFEYTINTPAESEPYYVGLWLGGHKNKILSISRPEFVEA